MEDDSGEMNVELETTNVAAHFLLRDQLFGFSASSGPDQVTYTIARLVSVQFS